MVLDTQMERSSESSFDSSDFPSRTSSESSSTFAEIEDQNVHTGYKKVLVTGGAGFIGSYVAEELLARGDDVVIVDELNNYYDVNIKRGNLQRLVTRYGPSRCKVYEGDICDVQFITGVFEKEKPEFVCHMAARAGVRPSIQDPFIYMHSNIEGTTRLLELAHKYRVRNFVFASSSSVYGEGTKEVFSETDAVDHPVSPYAMSKKACELIAFTYHHLYKLNITGLRFFTVYGPRGRQDMAPYKFIEKVCRGEEIQQFGDGSTSRDYTYISDIVDGVVRSIDRPLGYQIFNLGRGTPTSLKRFISLVEQCVGKKAIIKVCPEQAGDVPRTCANVEKAYRMLGYKAKVPFEEGIRLTSEWYLRDIMKVGVPEPLPITSSRSVSYTIGLKDEVERGGRSNTDCRIPSEALKDLAADPDSRIARSNTLALCF